MQDLLQSKNSLNVQQRVCLDIAPEESPIVLSSPLDSSNVKWKRY